MARWIVRLQNGSLLFMSSFTKSRSRVRSAGSVDFALLDRSRDATRARTVSVRRLLVRRVGMACMAMFCYRGFPQILNNVILRA